MRTTQTKAEFENYSDQCAGGKTQAASAVIELCEHGHLSIGEARVILKALDRPPWVPETDRAGPVLPTTQERVRHYLQASAR